ncbi:MAG: hypothetical protein JO108_04915 [Acidobacteriaceae bacterium]|nr:hypothetical protein [Acidobacteriaceae bacterium]
MDSVDWERDYAGQKTGFGTLNHGRSSEAGEEAAPDEAIKIKAEVCSEARAAVSHLEPYEAVLLNTSGSPQSQRAYGTAIDDFVAGYCSEPRITFNKTVVLRCRIQLASEASSPGDNHFVFSSRAPARLRRTEIGSLSPDLAARIQRVKGAKRLGVPLGDWLSARQAKDLLRRPSGEALIGKRDRAILGLLLGCGLRRSERAELTFENSSAGTITGPSSTCSAKAAIFDSWPFRTGLRVSSITRLPRPKSNPAADSVA